ncbi:phage tail protein I [Thalassomonas viridans]|uniref:Phage tail protein I n=1 Tax=Thalassomonas viridans TaxID=137584 RepID=A0AAE9Z3P4_9GAMM|nr:phage tail protein I [Thalassomonas viridans]WDE04673.1 phage tail protein I [Thalassomonas viridans]
MSNIEPGSLLPPNATTLESHLEQVIKAATDLPVPVSRLWEPEACPLSLLPWLAWAFSVDEWDDNWPEHIKRQVVQNSFDVHRYKGTPYAVQQALDGLNIKTQLREWWAPDGSQTPGTMTVVALINENLTDNDDGLITREMLEQVTRVVKSARRGVIHFDVELGLSLEENFALAAAASPATGFIDQEFEPLAVVPGELSNGLSAAAVSYQLCLSDINLEGIV